MQMNFSLLSKYGPKFWIIFEVDQLVIPADPELDSIIFQQRESVERIMVLGNIFEVLCTCMKVIRKQTQLA